MNKFVKQLSLGAVSLGIACCTSVPAFASTTPAQTKSASTYSSVTRGHRLNKSNTDATFTWEDDGINAQFSCDDGRPHDLKLHIEIMNDDFQIVKTVDRYATDFELNTSVRIHRDYHHAVCKFYGDGREIWYIGASPASNN